MNEPPPIPVATIVQAPPMMLGYAAMPKPKNSLWMGLQYAVAMVLAVLGPTILLVYLLWLGMMGKRAAPMSAGHVFGATMVLTFALPATSLAIWLRQRVLRQRAALDPSAPLGSWLDKLHAFSPWGLVIAGSTILAMVALSAVTCEGDWNDLLIPLGIATGVGIITLALGLGSLGARAAAARRVEAQRQALVPVATVVARPVGEDVERTQ